MIVKLQGLRAPVAAEHHALRRDDGQPVDRPRRAIENQLGDQVLRRREHFHLLGAVAVIFALLHVVGVVVATDKAAPRIV